MRIITQRVTHTTSHGTRTLQNVEGWGEDRLKREGTWLLMLAEGTSAGACACAWWERESALVDPLHG